jgi:hypothetical protein
MLEINYDRILLENLYNCYSSVYMSLSIRWEIRLDWLKCSGGEDKN